MNPDDLERTAWLTGFRTHRDGGVKCPHGYEKGDHHWESGDCLADEFDRQWWSEPLGDSDGGRPTGPHVTPSGDSRDAMSVSFVGPDLRLRVSETVAVWESMAGPANSVYETCARDLRAALAATKETA